MKVKALLSLVVCLCLLGFCAAGCKRREQVYANIDGPAATETVEPNAHY